MNTDFNDIERSYGRCLRRRDFIERFYELLLASDPRMQPLFAHTDFSQQNKALRRGISTAIQFAAGSGIVRRTIDEMARVHSRQGRAPVPPQLHELWLESMVLAVRESDPQADVALLKRWRQALSPIVQHFREHY